MVERLLDAAARLFDELGYHDTTTNDVAAAAGASVGSLYQYFPNKDALLVGLAERHVDEATAAMADAAVALRDEAPDLVGTCRAFVEAAVELNRSDRLHRLLWAAPRTEAITERLDRLTAALVDEVTWHLTRLGLPDETARRRATVLVGVVDAGVHTVMLDVDVLVEELVRLSVSYAGAEV
ncbi:MAG: TetR/AcrR family transcriptional regulator [Actinomycetota bacterium]